MEMGKSLVEGLMELQGESQVGRSAGIASGTEDLCLSSPPKSLEPGAEVGGAGK